jgi:hypothetical protein
VVAQIVRCGDADGHGGVESLQYGLAAAGVSPSDAGMVKRALLAA